MEKTKKIIRIIVTVIYVLTIMLSIAGTVLMFSDTYQKYCEGHYETEYSSTYPYKETKVWKEGYFYNVANAEAGIMPMMGVSILLVSFIVFLVCKKRSGMIISLILLIPEKLIMSLSLLIIKGTNGSLGFSIINTASGSLCNVIWLIMICLILFDLLPQKADDQLVKDKTQNEKFDELKKMKQLQEDGILTEEEFAMQKSKILGPDLVYSSMPKKTEGK